MEHIWSNDFPHARVRRNIAVLVYNRLHCRVSACRLHCWIGSSRVHWLHCRVSTNSLSLSSKWLHCAVCVVVHIIVIHICHCFCTMVCALSSSHWDRVLWSIGCVSRHVADIHNFSIIVEFIDGWCWQSATLLNSIISSSHISQSL